MTLDIDTEEEKEYPAVWMVGNCLEIVWKGRLAKKQIRPYLVRADLEARASLLRETRYTTHMMTLEEMLQLFM